MKFRTVFIASALILGGALATHALTIRAQGDMEKVMKLVEPGEAHQLFADKVGKWNLKVKLTSPGAPEGESDATSEMKWVLDGRFVEENFNGSIAGQGVTGLGYTGYDNMKQKYVGTWMDNTTTGIVSLEGAYDAATKTFTYTGEMQDPVQGKYVKMRSTEKVVDKDHMVMSTYSPGPDGKEMRMMEVSYTRAK
ncbi:MAG: DUF1579 domain-containing protein [Planctomycetota bacterium]|nr:DUF1579 domain-containing protein [Planctomycetota bacterium]